MAGNTPYRSIEFIARAALQERGRLLLCRNLAKGYFYLPGGHVEPGESAAEACARELNEEAGLRATTGRCLLVAEMRFEQDGRARHEVNVVFHVERPGGGDAEPIVSLERRIGFEWVALEDLPGCDLRPAAVRDWAAHALRSHTPPPMQWLSWSE